VPWKPGDQFKVTSESAPFYGRRGEIIEIEEDSPYPIVAWVEFEDKEFPVSYRRSEITLLADLKGTALLPAVDA